MKAKQYTMDMCSGSILKKMLRFALPLVFSGILQLLFNAADIIVVGKFAGDNSMGAVGSTSSLINLITNVFMGLSVGSNVLAARYFGAKQDEELSRTVHTSIFISFVGGIILTIVGFIFAGKLLVLMGTPDDILPLATLYLRVYFLGMTAMSLYNFGSALLRAVGDTKRPLYYLLASGVLNVILNLIFVIAFNMDVAGVALATVISQVMSAVLVIRCLMREQGGIRLYLKKVRFAKYTFYNMVRIGLPAGIQGSIFSLSNVVIQSAVNSFGEIVVSGNSAAASIEGFVYVAMNAFHQAAISFASQNYGVGNYKRINKILITSLSCVTITGAVFGNLVVLFARPLMSIYSSSDAVIAAGVNRINIICFLYFLCGTMDVAVGVLRGIGYSVIPMIVSLIGACGFRLLWIATVFQLPQYHKIQTVYISYPISWFMTFGVHLICYAVARRKMNRLDAAREAAKIAAQG